MKEADIKKVLLAFKVTESQMRQLKREAKKANLTTSGFVRHIVFNHIVSTRGVKK